MKLRLIFRQGIPDSDGKLAQYLYATDTVEVPAGSPALKLVSAENWPPEIVGGEWLEEAVK